MLSKNELKSLARLRQKKFRQQEQRLLLEGARLVHEALLVAWPVERVLATSAFSRHELAPEIFELAQRRGLTPEPLAETELRKLSETVTPQGIIAITGIKAWPRTPEQILQQPDCLLLAIEALHDPGNLGTIVRSAAWFAADGLVVGADCVSWQNPKVIRATMGAIFHLPVFERSDFAALLQQARQAGATIIAADQAGEISYSHLKRARKSVLLLGDEARGLSPEVRELAGVRVAIPRQGTGESLNVSVAAAILLAAMAPDAPPPVS